MLAQIEDADSELKVDLDSTTGLKNAYSKITQFITNLYTKEFGSPPLYAELNRHTR